MLLTDMKDLYLNYVFVTFSNGTHKCYSSHLNSLYKFLEKNNILYDYEITNKLLFKYIIEMRNNGVSNSTINKRFKPLKLMFEYCNIENNCLSALKMLKESQNHFNSLSSIELNKLVDYLNSSKLILKNKLIIFLLLETGIRINELLNIKIKNINFNNNSIYLEKTKTCKSRYVYFKEGTSYLLKQYLNTICNDLLFNMNYSAVRSLFDRIKKQLDLNKFHPHMLRHTFASVLHKNGTSIFILMTLLGHENLKTTERYVHYDNDFIHHTFMNNMNY